jgi:predicted metal-dependent peptidase
MAVATKQDNTSTDLGNSRYSATEAEAAKFDLEPHLVRLMWDEPFYSKVLRGISKIKTNEIPTAGVAIRDGKVQFYWNPMFCASIIKDGGADKIKGLSIHECLHLVFDHCVGRKKDPHIIWNYATDCAINSLIPRAYLPDGGIVPGEAFTLLTEEQKEKMDDKRIESYERLSAFIKSLPLGLASEEYFALFMREKDIVEDLKGQEQQAQPGQPGGEGEGPALPGPLDDHDGWGELSEEDRELVKGKIKQAIKDAAQDCDSKGQWGSVGADTRQTIREMICKDIPWQALIKQFVGMSRRAERSTSRMRLNKKYPGIHSGFKRGYTANIAVYIDQSGSVSNGELELLFGCLRDLAKRTEFTTFHFDTDVDLDSKTTWRGGRTPDTHRTRCGGTCFDAPTIHANKNKSTYDGCLILTDGYAPTPVHSRLKRAWIITTEGDQAFKCGSETVIKMKTPKVQKAA